MGEPKNVTRKSFNDLAAQTQRAHNALSDLYRNGKISREDMEKRRKRISTAWNNYSGNIVRRAGLENFYGKGVNTSVRNKKYTRSQYTRGKGRITSEEYGQLNK